MAKKIKYAKTHALRGNNVRFLSDYTNMLCRPGIRLLGYCTRDR